MLPSPTDPVLRIASGFMAAKQLFVANEIGLFEALAEDKDATLDTLAARTGIAPSRLRILADGLCALGLIARRDGRYCSEAAAACLSGAGPDDLRPLLRFWNHIAYPMWMGLETAVRTGQAQGSMAPAGERQRIWSEGVEAIQAPPARVLAEAFDFAPRRRVLDLGGGTGSWLRALLERHAALSGTLFDLPCAVALAQPRLAAEGGVGDRVQFVAGDFFRDALPGGHDVVLLANVLHLFEPARNLELLRRLRAASAPGTALLLADFWTDDTHTEPPLAALLAAEFMVITGQGDVYSAAQLQAWLVQTGWRAIEHRPLAGAVSLWTAQAV